MNWYFDNELNIRRWLFYGFVLAVTLGFIHFGLTAYYMKNFIILVCCVVAVVECLHVYLLIHYGGMTLKKIGAVFFVLILFYFLSETGEYFLKGNGLSSIFGFSGLRRGLPTAFAQHLTFIVLIGWLWESPYKCIKKNITPILGTIFFVLHIPNLELMVATFIGGFFFVSIYTFMYSKRGVRGMLVVMLILVPAHYVVSSYLKTFIPTHRVGIAYVEKFGWCNQK